MVSDNRGVALVRDKLRIVPVKLISTNCLMQLKRDQLTFIDHDALIVRAIQNKENERLETSWRSTLASRLDACSISTIYFTEFLKYDNDGLLKIYLYILQNLLSDYLAHSICKSTVI